MEKLNKSIHSKLFFTYNALRDEFEEVSCDEMGLVILYDESNYVSGMCSIVPKYEKIEDMEKEIRTKTSFGISEKKFKKKFKELFGKDAEVDLKKEGKKYKHISLTIDNKENPELKR